MGEREWDAVGYDVARLVEERVALLLLRRQRQGSQLGQLSSALSSPYPARRQESHHLIEETSSNDHAINPSRGHHQHPSYCAVEHGRRGRVVVVVPTPVSALELSAPASTLLYVRVSIYQLRKIEVCRGGGDCLLAAAIFSSHYSSRRTSPPRMAPGPPVQPRPTKARGLLRLCVDTLHLCNLWHCCSR